MAFVARIQETSGRVCVLDFDRLLAREHVRQLGTPLCQICGERVMVKAGLVRRPHFAHYPGERAASCTGAESIEHLAAKDAIHSMLQEIYAEAGLAVKVELEVDLRKECGRIADVLVTYPSEARHAHEAQLSSITTGDLKKRTDSYYAQGINVSWYLGKSAATETNVAWCEDHQVECWTISTDRARPSRPDKVYHHAYS